MIEAKKYNDLGWTVIPAKSGNKINYSLKKTCGKLFFVVNNTCVV